MQRRVQLGRPVLLANAFSKLAFTAVQGVFSFSALTTAHPLLHDLISIAKKKDEEDGPKDTDDPSLWIYLSLATFLVLLGGVFAGLTIALMGQDEIYLQVTAESGEGSERRHAARVLRLLKRGKHWVLVTLLLGNVITNETLPIVLDRSLGGGWAAVVISTTAIVIFGEIAPQSICVRYGLPIGAALSIPVLGLMWLMSPIAWPIAKLLDYLLGEDHGTIYKKAGLKTLVTLHRTLGQDERLNKDEVTIISAVLDLKEKQIGSIMTPMDDVFVLSSEAVLDQETVDEILAEGYSRIPIHSPDNEANFVGMLLVKMLITYDPEDCFKVSDFQLATLPETRPETSCLDILNFFQEGKSHMILVSEYPGDDHGCMGVVTLEDVIEEMIGEEIIDESDVYIDVHKAVRRMQRAPLFRVPKGQVVEPPPENTDVAVEAPKITQRQSMASLRHASMKAANGDEVSGSRKNSSYQDSVRDGGRSALLRRRSGGPSDSKNVKSTNAELREHLKHLGPSNAASRPKSTRINTVKIKPGLDSMTTLPENKALNINQRPAAAARAQSLLEAQHDDDADETTGLLARRPMSSSGGETSGLLSAGREASDGVHAVNYGATATSPTAKFTGESSLAERLAAEEHSEPTSPKSQPKTSPKADAKEKPTVEPLITLDPPEPESKQNGDSKLDSLGANHHAVVDQQNATPASPLLNAEDLPAPPKKLVIKLERTQSQITDVPDDYSQQSSDESSEPTLKDGSNEGGLKPSIAITRSGSIVENHVHSGGVKKMVLDVTHSADDHSGDEGSPSGPVGAVQPPTPAEDGEAQPLKKKTRGTRAGAKVKQRAEKKKAAAEKRENSSTSVPTLSTTTTNGSSADTNGKSANGDEAKTVQFAEGSKLEVVKPDTEDADDLPDDVETVDGKKKKTRRGGKKVTKQRMKAREASSDSVLTIGGPSAS